MNYAGNGTLTRQLITAVAVLIALAGCGNKSGLFMPEKPPTQTQDEATQSNGAEDQGDAADTPVQKPEEDQ
ncbi:MAG: lipoprotein [Gammaproteobacteria bacterium]|nr:lipoprotein [Gammaproteobacteria bacterium]